MGVSHIVMKDGYILEGWVDSGRVAYLRGYFLGRRGRFWEGGIDSGSIAYRKGGYILERYGLDSGSPT